MEPKIRYSKAMDTFIGGNRYFAVSVSRPMNDGITLKHWEIWKKEGEKVVEILPYGNLNSYSRVVAQFKEVCRNAELNLAMSTRTNRKENKVESTGNGATITIHYGDGKTTFLQGDDAFALCNYFAGNVPTAEELYKSRVADLYRDLAR